MDYDLIHGVTSFLFFFLFLSQVWNYVSNNIIESSYFLGGTHLFVVGGFTTSRQGIQYYVESGPFR